LIGNKNDLEEGEGLKDETVRKIFED